LKVRAQDLKAGDQVWTNDGVLITLEAVHIFEEKKSPFRTPGQAQPYFPACVLVVWNGGARQFAFEIDEQVDKKIPLVGG
jgi:hypothetical protein